MRWRYWMTGLGVGLWSACLTVDPFFFDPRPVDREYGWDDDPCDPLLLGEMAEAEHRVNGGPPPSCHPSLVPAEDRVEGFVELDDGRRIHHVFAHRQGATATFVFSHGTSWHLGRYWDRVEMLWGMGYHVLVYDYPGYGRSDGEPDEVGVFESAAAVVEQVLPQMPGVDLTRVFFYGYSLGGAPTFELALRANSDEGSVVPRGVITESTFCSAQTLGQDAARLDLPGEFLAEARWDNCAKIARLDPALPVLLMHGGRDDFIVPVHAKELRDAAIGEDVTLRWVHEADHSELPALGQQEYRGWIEQFVAQHEGE